MTRHSNIDWGLLILRVGLASLLITLHGGPRLVRVFWYFVRGEPWPFIGLVAGIGFPLPLLFALLSTVADSFGALFAGLGFLTRWAALMMAINMSVAVYFETTGGDPFELPALHLLGALVLLVTGPGAFSLDALRAKESQR
jgi:putative oxidoreductase